MLQHLALWILDPWIDLAIILLVSIVAMSDFYRRFYLSIKSAPRLDELSWEGTQLPSITVIIPAYNEAVNIEACLKAVLENQLPDPLMLQVIVADDDSTDGTLALAENIATDDERALTFNAGPRPENEVWRGKNWACDRAIQKATGDYLLFIDADVRLQPQAIAQSVLNAQKYQSDLLSCAPAVVNGCFAEWLVQPLMVNLIAIGFDFEGVNNPAKPEVALAAGPFMLFLREAYDKIGGHRGVASNAVEDVALAGRIKTSGLRLRYVLGLELSSVRMYRSFGALWEGWTKNYYLGANRNILLTLVSASAVFLIFVMPWLGLVVSVIGALTGQLTGEWAVGLVLLAAIAVGLQIGLRLWTTKAVSQPLRYVWLGWLAGLVVSAIAIASIIKTETGWGWTWRGRSLADSSG